MANEKNLVCGKATQFRSGEEAARNGQIGGRASGEARRRKKSLREAADYFLSLPVAEKKTWDKIAAAGVEPEEIDYQMAIIVGLSSKAIKGDSKAAKVLVDLLGDAPGSDTTETNNLFEAINRVEEIDTNDLPEVE